MLLCRKNKIYYHYYFVSKTPPPSECQPLARPIPCAGSVYNVSEYTDVHANVCVCVCMGVCIIFAKNHLFRTNKARTDHTLRERRISSLDGLPVRTWIIQRAADRWIRELHPVRAPWHVSSAVTGRIYIYIFIFTVYYGGDNGDGVINLRRSAYERKHTLPRVSAGAY